jgi:hypothetical protein
MKLEIKYIFEVATMFLYDKISGPNDWVLVRLLTLFQLPNLRSLTSV